MIYTLTFNPSLDYTIEVPDFALDKTNRTSKEEIYAGGKGINVSTVLHNLGLETTALGFVAGFTGKEIQRILDSGEVPHSFIEIEEGYSRINIKMKDFDGCEINGMGPRISKKHMDEMLDGLKRLNRGDTLVLAGSIPAGMQDDLYANIMKELEGNGIRFVVDATGGLLEKTLNYHPFLIKPNIHEIGELFGVELKMKEDTIPYTRKLQEKGARNVLVSASGQGALLVDETGEVYQREAPKGKLVNAVGAGDSMVAGFLAGYITKKSYEDAFLTAVAAGSASAFSQGLATKEKILEIMNQMQ